MSIETLKQAVEMALKDDETSVTEAYDYMISNHSERMEALNLTCCEYVDLLISEGVLE